MYRRKTPLPLRMNHNKLKHGRPGSDPPTPPPAAKRRLEDNTEEVAALREQISELADKLGKQAEEISQLRKAVSNLTEAQTRSNKKPLTPAAPEQSRKNPEPTKAHPPPPAKPEHIPSHPIPQNPLHRYSDRRLILNPAIPKEKQKSGGQIVNEINQDIRNRNRSACIDAIVYSRNGRPIVIASKGWKAEDLLPHTDIIAKRCYSSSSGVVAYPDRQLFWVKLNGVPAMDQYGSPVPVDQIVKHLGDSNDILIPLHVRPTWIKPLCRQTHSTIVFSFCSREDATAFLRYRDFLVSGERCRATEYKNHPPAAHHRLPAATNPT